MPRAGGVFTLEPGYFAVSGTTIQVSQHNPVLEDIAAAMTASLPRDGSAPMTGPLAMGSQKITGLAAGTNPGDAVRFDQRGASSAWLTSVSGLSLLADEMVYANGTNIAAKTALTAKGRALAAAVTSLAFTAGTNAQGQGVISADTAVVRITTAAANPSGVTLPATTVVGEIIIKNATANPVNVYPPASSAINALSVNAAFSLAPGQTATFVGVATTLWDAMAFGDNALTTRGDLLTRGATAAQRLAIGTTGQVLTSDGTDVLWGAAAGWVLAVTHTVVGTDAGNIITGLGPYKDIWIVGVGITSTLSGIKGVRAGPNTGVLNTSIYRDATSTTTYVRFSDSTNGLRSFSMQIMGFNQTAPVKGILVTGNVGTADMPVAIESAASFDRIQVRDVSNANNLTGGTVYVFGRT